jgi:ribonucleoside-diphosphate reductase alpha chain
VPKPLKNLFVTSILSFGKQKNNEMHARHVDGDVWSGKHRRSIGLMTEQQVAAQSAQETETGNREKMTQLEGIRQKVFMDRYSLKDASGNALEHYPEQMWARVARGIAEVEKTPEARAEWEKKFYDALENFQFVPGGRILAGAGSGHQVTFYNCYVIPSPEDSRQGILDNLKLMTEIMARGGGVGINLSTLRPRGSYIRTVNGTASGPCSWAQLYSVATGDVIQQGGCFGPDERIATDHGLIPAKELVARLEKGEMIRARTHKGLRPFTYVFHNGTKDLYEVTTNRGYKVRVTLDHKMGVLRKGEITTVPLRELTEGDEILLLLGNTQENVIPPVPLKTSEYVRSKMSTTLNENVILPTHLTRDLAYLLGFFYGDSSVIQGKKVTWQDEKGIAFTIEDSRPAIQNHLIACVQELFGLEPIITKGDGACTTIQVYSRILVEWLQSNGLLKQKSAHMRVPEVIFRSPAEVVSAFIGGFFDADGCDRGSKGGYRIDSVSRKMLEDLQLLLLQHGIVSHITTQDRSAEGWLNIHRLIISGAQFRKEFSAFIACCKDMQRQGYRSHFSNYPMEVWDTLGIPGRYYQGLFDSTKERVSHYALTRVRDRVVAAGSVALVEKLDELLNVLPDKIVSIEPLGLSEVYDFEVDDVHLLSGGGIYTSNSRRGALMLMLDDDHPDIEEFITVKRTPGKIEHANLSVCISDKFMQAVKDDADWNLVWQGEVKKTVRARDLWDLICTSAWESAEPGVVFMDRYNKLSNTWYYENIRCVNPCVTGDTLVSTEHGYMPARDLRIGMNIRTPAGLKPIEKMYNNGFQRIYRVDLSDGGYLKCTADHKLKVVRGKKYEWVPVSELTEGDKVLVVANEVFGPRQNLPAKALEYIAKRGLNVAKYYDRKLGLIVGTIIGDGTLRELPNRNSYSYQCKIAFGSHEDEWYHTFHNLMADMNIHTLRQVSEKDFPVGGGGVAIKHASVRLECYKLASLLVRIGMTPNIKAPQKTIPLAFMSMEKEFLAGILDGLFSTDGSVLMKQDNPMLRFHTSSYELAQQVRLILLQFGIHARIYRATRDEDLMYDGRSMYGTGEKYDVIVMNEGIARFYAEIGLSHPEKAARLKEIAENWHYIGGTWTASVVSVADTGTEEEVFDLYEPETLTWITNGYCSLDCGEQGLPPFGVCNLGALNLSAFVENGQMNYERLAEKTRVAMRFLDNVVDATEYFIPENAEAQLGTRRTGLGTMGLADALIKMKIAYGSDSSLPVIEKIYATIRDAAYEASADYAAEKGAFPRFERDKYMQGQFIKQLPRPIQEKIRKHGTRNAVLLTQAPTGTTSLLAGVSSGIEPVYDFAMIRRDRTGEHILYHPLLQAWRDEHPNEPTPGYFVSSKDLSPEEHVRVQATIQKYTDSSISKTVNAPNEHTVDQVRTLYRLAYEMGCKGITYYRDGSRDAVLTRIEDEKKTEQQVEEQAAMVEPVASIQQGIKPLPAVVHGYTRHLNSPEGKVNITINSDEHGPLEVFINVGKAGSDIAALAEALGRLISLNLRILSPLSQIDRAKVIAEQLRSIGGSRSVGFGAQQVRSMPDAVARALELHIASLQQEAEQQLESAPPANGHSNHNSESDPQAGEASPLTLSKLSVTGNLCPECGCNTMVFEEGCKKCYTCGHSEC